MRLQSPEVSLNICDAFPGLSPLRCVHFHMQLGVLLGVHHHWALLKVTHPKGKMHHCWQPLRGPGPALGHCL